MALPDTMRVIKIEAPGGPEALVPGTQPIVPPTGRQVLIEAAAVGVNRPDVLQRIGAYPPPKGHSPLPGLEVAGTVVAVGDAVQRWRVGDQVCALLNGGGYASHTLCDERHALTVPAGVPRSEAAGMPETVFTVRHNVF
ncbi:MAG: alcohol dehydrogenase catalytic domain-containing protein, partial [Pseudomonadota bacterium]